MSYIYQSYEKKRKKMSPIWLLITFFVALFGSYYGQIYLSRIVGTENNIEIEKTSYLDTKMENSNAMEYKQEDIIEDVMESVVGISKLQVNEESIFDISVSQKWGLRYRNYCL